MGIKFLNRDKTLTQQEIGPLRTTRPKGYTFPIGFSALSSGSIDYVVVAGGGPGGDSSGGGAGGFLTGTNAPLPASGSVKIVVGAGGVHVYGGATGSYSSANTWSNGETPSFGAKATGGGSGLYNNSIGYLNTGGGSGGGGSVSGYPYATGGSGGIPGQGNNGGAGMFYGFAPIYGGGAGGGAGGIGGSTDGTGANGGIGLATTIAPNGASTYYAGGGSGRHAISLAPATYVPHYGGLGGGGNDDTNGTTNTGGGGGGKDPQGNGGTGGSGIVVIRYPSPQRAYGGTVTTGTGTIIHTFTGDGWFNTNSDFIGTWSIN